MRRLALLLLLLAGCPKPSTPTAALDAGVACPPIAVKPPRPLAGAEGPPLLLWATGEVRLFVDGQAAFSPPESPRFFPAGEHTLKVEAPGRPPLETRFRLSPFTPALFHAEVRDDVLTLVRLGSVCTSCTPPVIPPELTFARSKATAMVLFEDAAAALQRDDWASAAAKLKGVRPADRSHPLFLRLAAAVYASAAMPDEGRRALRGISAKQSPELPALLAALERLEASERKREQDVVMARWNATTERFGRLVSHFESELPGATAAGAARLAELSRAFESAMRARDVVEQDITLRAAEAALEQLVAQLRSSRPDDCAFQNDVVATLVR